MKSGTLFLLLTALATAGLAPCADISGNPPPYSGNNRLKQRQVARQTSQPRALNALVLRAVADMPKNGGYAVSREAAKKLANQAVVWDEATRTLKVDIQQSQPSFCSAACYVVLLHSLQLWQQARSGAGGDMLPPAAWKAMDVVLGTPDGKGIWGRANANGPGFAKMVHDLGVGVNFSSMQQARPGDFLKFFWNEEIGAKERGHMVVFLGLGEVDGQPAVHYWSANKPDGFSERTVPLSQMHHLIFTRITKPENFVGAGTLPETDTWLRDMQKVSVPFVEVCERCGIVAPASMPSSSQPPAPRPSAARREM